MDVFGPISSQGVALLGDMDLEEAGMTHTFSPDLEAGGPHRCHHLGKALRSSSQASLIVTGSQLPAACKM